MADLNIRSALMAQNPLFKSLSPMERRQLLDRCVVRKYDAHELVLQDGQEAECVYVLLLGSVRVYHNSPNGLEVVVKIFKPPSVFGEMEVMTGLLFLENVQTLEPSELLLVPRDLFIDLVRTKHEVCFSLLEDVCARLCIACHNEKSLAFFDVRTRLANFLACYAEFDGEHTPSGIRLRLKITQDDMASALGVTRRAIAKEINRLKNSGILKKDRGYYTLLDLEKLKKEASEMHLSIVHRMGQSHSFPKRG